MSLSTLPRAGRAAFKCLTISVLGLLLLALLAGCTTAATPTLLPEDVPQQISIRPTAHGPLPTAKPTSIPPTPLPAIEPTKINFDDALSQKLLNTTAAGNGLQSVLLNIASETKQDLAVVVPMGSIFISGSSDVQNMITTQEMVAVLRGQSAITIQIPAACVNMHRRQPESKDNLTYAGAAATDPDLLNLLALPEFQQAENTLKQYAVWQITDDPEQQDFVPIGMFGAGTGPSDEDMKQISMMLRKIQANLCLGFGNEEDSAIAAASSRQIISFPGQVLDYNLAENGVNQVFNVDDFQIFGALAVSPNGKQAALGGTNTANFAAIQFLDLPTETAQFTYLIQTASTQVLDMAYSPDGLLLAAVTSQGFGQNGAGNNQLTLLVLDAQTGKIQRTFALGKQQSTGVDVRFSPDGSRLALAHNTLTIWDIQKGWQLSSLLAGVDDGISRLAFSPDSQTLVVGGKAGAYLLAAGKDTAAVLQRPFAIPGSDSPAVGFSADGKWILEGMDNMLFAYDAQTYQGRLVKTLNVSKIVDFNMFSGYDQIIVETEGKTCTAQVKLVPAASLEP